MSFHHGPHHGETEARPRAAGGEKRLEDAFFDVVGDAGAVVGDADCSAAIRETARLESQHDLVARRLNRVGRDIEQRTQYDLAHTVHGRVSRMVDDLQTAAALLQLKLEGLFQVVEQRRAGYRLMREIAAARKDQHVVARALELAQTRQQLVSALNAIGLLELWLAQHGHVQHGRSERSAYLMGETSDYFAHRGEALMAAQ